MAGPFYVDLGSPGAWDGHDGTNNTTECWLGISGLQHAFNTVDKAEICYLTGTGDLSKFYICPVDNVSGQFTAGEGISWGADATAGTGVLVTAITTGGTSIEFELLTGVHPANNLQITGAASAQTMDCDDAADTGCIIKTIDVDTKAGTNADGFIKFIGVDSDWSGRTTRAKINGNGGAAAVHGLTVTGTVDLLWLENIEVYGLGGSAKHGFYFSSNDSRGCVMLNCCAHDCSGVGFNLYYCNFGYLIRCVAYHNTGDGFSGGCNTTRLFCCASKDNSGDGFDFASAATSYRCDLIGCISHDNDGDGYSITYGHFMMNCVSDANGDDGIINVAHTELYPALIIGCRITNHANGANPVAILTNSDAILTGWNFFDGNTADISGTLNYFIPLEGTANTSNVEAGDDINEGYVSTAGEGDFSTNYVDATDPTIRRTAITVPWS